MSNLHVCVVHILVAAHVPHQSSGHAHLLPAPGTHVWESRTGLCRVLLLSYSSFFCLISTLFMVKNMSIDAVSSLSGCDSDARRTYRIFPGWHSNSDGWPHDPEAHHISCGSSSVEPHVWQGERTYLDLRVITETRLNLQQTGMCKSEGKIAVFKYI